MYSTPCKGKESQQKQQLREGRKGKVVRRDGFNENGLPLVASFLKEHVGSLSSLTGNLGSILLSRGHTEEEEPHRHHVESNFQTPSCFRPGRLPGDTIQSLKIDDFTSLLGSCSQSALLSLATLVTGRVRLRALLPIPGVLLETKHDENVTIQWCCWGTRRARVFGWVYDGRRGARGPRDREGRRE